jgi:hypothetical protein
MHKMSSWSEDLAHYEFMDMLDFASFALLYSDSLKYRLKRQLASCHFADCGRL